MTTFMPNRKFVLSAALCMMLLFAVLASTGDIFAAAGPGTSIGGGGGGCAYYSTTFDTCYGGSWRYYSLDSQIPVRQSGSKNYVTYDKTADSVTIPPASQNVDGGTISGCVADNSTGFFKFGLEVYAPPSSSQNYQAGLIQKGSIKNAFDSSAQYTGADVRANAGQMSAFIKSLPHGATFSNDGVMELFDFVSENGQNSGYYWSDSTLAWFCTGMLEQPSSSEFYSRSNISVEGIDGYKTTADDDIWPDKSQANEIITVQSKSSLQITFSHDMKYTGTLPNDKAKKDWSYTMTVNGTAAGKVTQNGAAFNAESRPNPRTGNYAPAAQTGTPVVASHTYTLTMPEVTSTETLTVCEQIDYKDKKLEGDTFSGGDSWTKACVSITISPVPEENVPVVGSCPLPNSSYSVNFGSTQAQSGVVNLTKDGTWKTTDGTTSTPAVVWAKPGDSVQFKHTLCFGAQKVRGSNKPSSDNGRTTDPDRNILPPQNSATIRAFTTPASGGNYLFGKTLSGTGSQSFTLTKGVERPTQVSGADQVGDFWFTYYSPSVKSGNAAADTYKCYAADRGFPTFKTNGYQIPDFISTTVPANCSSASKVPTVSDAGKIIEQDLEWKNVIAYVNQKNTGSGGSCGCSCSNSNNAYANNVGVDYNGAMSASSDGTIGNRVRKCYNTGSRCGGGCCSDCSGCCGRRYGLTNYKYFPLSTSNAAGAAQKAQVKIPFNYTTKTTAKIDSTVDGIVFGGGDLSTNVNIAIKPRDNKEVAGDKNPPYATISKNSVYEVVVFTVTPDAAQNKIQPGSANQSMAKGKDTLACEYYNNSSYVDACKSVYRSGTTERLNAKGDLLGDPAAFNKTYNLAIPDAEAGTKICVAVGVWPSDSHDFGPNPAGAKIASSGTEAAMDENNSGNISKWNYSAPSCKTIAKKPTVQVWGAGVYTKGSISTAQTFKSVSYSALGKFGETSRLESDSVENGNRRVFGSWAEYEAIALKGIRNFGSGAAFGYELNNGGKSGGVSKGTEITATPGGYPNVGHSGSSSFTASCKYNKETISNTDCGNSGYANINIGDSVITRLLARYTSSSSSVPVQSGSLNLSAAYRLEAGPRYVKTKGDAAIAGEYCMSGSNAANNTLVIDVDGVLEIKGNLTYGTSSGGRCIAETYSDIASLPQIIIIAEEIRIADTVTNIDAWLISGYNGGSGVINTCFGHEAADRNSATDICSRQLIVNGPVFAKELRLNRTYGAGSELLADRYQSPDPKSIDAAEIFNLRPDTYFWAYNQAQRFSQAVTTYIQELAPRY